MALDATYGRVDKAGSTEDGASGPTGDSFRRANGTEDGSVNSSTRRWLASKAQDETTCETEEQLRSALAMNITKVMGYFRAWDEDGDGNLSCKEVCVCVRTDGPRAHTRDRDRVWVWAQRAVAVDSRRAVQFRRAVSLLGLHAAKTTVDKVFSDMDPDNSGDISVKEFHRAMQPKKSTLLQKQRASGPEASLRRLRDVCANGDVVIIDLMREYGERKAALPPTPNPGSVPSPHPNTSTSTSTSTSTLIPTPARSRTPFRNANTNLAPNPSPTTPDTNRDNTVCRSEFCTMLATLPLGEGDAEPFTQEESDEVRVHPTCHTHCRLASAMLWPATIGPHRHCCRRPPLGCAVLSPQLFSYIDKDCSGAIDYLELDAELRRARHVQTPEAQRSAARGLLRHDHVVFVLGLPTRMKKTLCSRLAYTFDGTWIAARDLARREMHTLSASQHVEINRCLERDEQVPPALMRACLVAAIRGHTTHPNAEYTNEQRLRGPFFLFDLPRSVRELDSIERALGVAPLALHYEQAALDSATNGTMRIEGHDEVLAAFEARSKANCLPFALCLSAEVENKSLVDMVIRRLKDLKSEQALHRLQQRSEMAVQREVAQQAHRAYLELRSQQMASALRVSVASHARSSGAYTERQRKRVELHRQQKQQRLEEHLTGTSALPHLGRSSVVSRSLDASPRNATAMDLRQQQSSSYGVNLEPRVDLQLPLNWREATPCGKPALSLPSIRGVYSTRKGKGSKVGLGPTLATY